MIKTPPPWKFIKQFIKRDPDQIRYDRLVERLESPIEIAFWANGYKPLSALGQFAPQTKIGEYRVDFTLTNIPGVPQLKVVIELDGYNYHRTAEQFATDTSRNRALQIAGWQVIRFTGAEINGDVRGCVRETADLVRGFRELFRRLR